jgi:hypothetical protein
VLGGTAERGVGLYGAFGVAARKLLSYNAIAWLNLDTSHIQATLGIPEGIDNYVSQIGYYRKINENAELAGEIQTNWKNKTTTLEFGGLYRPFEDGVFRAKLSSMGFLGLAFSYQFFQSLRLTAATNVDTKRVGAAGVTDYQIGFKAEFTDIS